ncbi:MAG: CHAT domain-containing protein [Saprospiraceae bacterium]|nr:CHAT domain-containing protein [Saprospiraceae bacterium]
MSPKLNLLLAIVIQVGIRSYLSAQDTLEAHQLWSEGMHAFSSGLYTPAAQSFEKAAQLFTEEHPFRHVQCNIWRLHCLIDSVDVAKEIDDLLDRYDNGEHGFSDREHVTLLAHLWLLKGSSFPDDVEERQSLHNAANLVEPFAEQAAQIAAMIYLRTGIYHYQNETHDSAIHYFEKAIPLASGRELVLIEGEIYLQWAQALRRIGDLQKAKQLVQSGVQVIGTRFGEMHPELATGYNNLAIIEKALGNEEAASFSFQRALRIREALYGRTSNEYGIVLNNAALQFLDDGQVDVAEQYAKQTIEIFEKLAAPNGRFHVASYNTLAKVYSRRGAHDRAFPFYQKAVDLHLRYFPDNSRVRFYYLDLGRNAQARGRVSETLHHFHQAMCATIEGLDEENIHDNPGRDHLANYQTLKHLCLLKASAWMDHYASSSDTSDLMEAIGLYDLADHFATKNRTEVSFQKSKMLFSRQNLPIYEGAIKAYITLAELTGDPAYYGKAFLKNEKSKSLTLLESLLEASALQHSAIDQEVLAREAALQDSLARVRQLVMQSTGSLREELMLKKTDLELAYEHFKSSLEEKYPRYHQAKYNFNFVDLEELSSSCASDETMLEYFVGREHIYLFLISKKGSTVQYIPRPVDLESRVQHFLEALGAFNPQMPITDQANVDHLKQYVDQAYGLYELLLKPVEQQVSRRLKIVPDGVLNLLPFGALLPERPEDLMDMRSYLFVEKTKAISYNYSATLYHTMQGQIALRSDMMAVAPSFAVEAGTEARQFGPLLFNEIEATQVSSIFPGKLLTGASATKSAVLQDMDRFGILHFATHAKVDDQNSDLSFLAFHGGDRLFLHELYNLQLPIQLVTLSACETNVGPVQTGEGLASLARGFSYAGAKSIVTSLWDVQDKAATDIMQYFYTNLAEDLPKDQALQRAKMSYLEKSTGNLMHPFFWATFILIGSEEPIFMSNHWQSRLWWSLIIGSVLVIFFFIRKQIHELQSKRG